MKPFRLLGFENVRLRVVAIGLFGVLAVCGDAFAESETEPSPETPIVEPTETEKPAALRPETYSNSARTSPTEYAGVQGRIGHIAFPTFGRRDSITHLEFLPYIIVDNDMLFGDARMFTDNEGRFGTNAGAGLRRWVPAWERVFGASLWFDYDEGSGKPFQAAGLSLESLGQSFDVRANGYLPVGDREQEYFKRFSNIRYQGNQIIADYLRKFSEAQSGFDLELGVALPSEFAAERNMRIVGGYYHFFGDKVPDIDGYKARLEGSLTGRVDLQVQYTDDNAFGTNVTLGAAYHFGGSSSRSPESDAMLRQMTRYVQRNYNVIVTKREDISYHHPAINPATGRPYVVQHVSSLAAGTGSGTQSAPLMTIAQAQAGDPDLILVHSGSVLTSPIVLAPGQRILGEGADHIISIQGIGDVLLPAFSGGTALPVLEGVAGDAVVLATGSEFSGFVIDGPTGQGIVANGIAGATVRNVTIQNALGDGLFVMDSTGPFVFENVHLTNNTGSAFHVAGGAADVLFNGAINNSAGRAVLIENTTAGGISLQNAGITDIGGTGLLLANNAGNVFFGNVDVQNSTESGIDIQGGTGTTQFTTQTTITNSAGPAIHIENAAGDTNLNQVAITNTNGSEGVRIINSTGTTTLSDLNLTTNGGSGLFALSGGEVGLFAGSIHSTNAAAVDIQNTTIDIDLASVSSFNAATGIRIVDSPGAFIVRGDGSAGSGGLIQGAGVGILAQNSGGIALQNLVLDGNGTGISATNMDSIVFHVGRITNSTGQAVDLFNVKQFELFDSTLAGNAGQSLQAQFDVAGDYEYILSENMIETSSSAPIVLSTLPSGAGSTLALSFESNTITTTAIGSQALDLDWTGGFDANITGNTITADGANSTGFDINTSSATAEAQIAIGQNSLTFGGDNSTGIKLSTSGPSNISIGENTTVFNAANGVGVDFDIGSASLIDIFDNRITDNISSGTGLLFSSITGPSTVTIDNNTIELLSPDALPDRGILFNTVTGDVQLMGTKSNTITRAETEFTPGGTTGQIIINDVAVP